MLETLPNHTTTADTFVACSAELLRDVVATGEGLLITENGKPLARLVPMTESQFASRTNKIFGCMAGTGRIVGDIVGPVSTPTEWAVTEADMLKKWDTLHGDTSASA
jgi:prevent-host-death family protein